MIEQRFLGGDYVISYKVKNRAYECVCPVIEVYRLAF